MPAINIRIDLYRRALRRDVDVVEVVNKSLEEHLEELENEG